jgi:hypothetical protein
MFWTFTLSFDILATVLATFPNIGRLFVQFSGHSGHYTEYRYAEYHGAGILCLS